MLARQKEEGQVLEGLKLDLDSVIGENGHLADLKRLLQLHLHLELGSVRVVYSL